MHLETFQFTPDNLLSNMDLIGAWSCYGLAETAIKHYHPECREEESEKSSIGYMASLKCDGKENTWWIDWIRKYHTEVGYSANELNIAAVNQF
jgi:hypothetical protein